MGALDGESGHRSSLGECFLSMAWTFGFPKTKRRSSVAEFSIGSRGLGLCYAIPGTPNLGLHWTLR